MNGSQTLGLSRLHLGMMVGHGRFTTCIAIDDFDECVS